MKLPFLVSVPHGGQHIPKEAAPYCALESEEILADSDEGAREIYASLEEPVAVFVTTDTARAIIDLNRAEDDRRSDGVVKTETCWNVTVYDTFPPDAVVEELLERYYRPYHRQLTEAARSTEVRLGLDCHTMLAVGPPIGPMAGEERPHICLSNVDGASCPASWFEQLALYLEEEFGVAVARNEPFKGGFITRSHSAELPWVQIELSRAAFLSNAEKGQRVLRALKRFASEPLRLAPVS